MLTRQLVVPLLLSALTAVLALGNIRTCTLLFQLSSNKTKVSLRPLFPPVSLLLSCLLTRLLSGRVPDVSAELWASVEFHSWVSASFSCSFSLH